MLVNKMNSEDMNYPLHLGVTEAGEAEDGRIKSAVGIGTLLHDGLGDTIRVSLTEEPEAELPVAKILVERYSIKFDDERDLLEPAELPYDPFFYTRRRSNKLINVGENQIPRVVGDLSRTSVIRQDDLQMFGYFYHKEEDKWHISEMAVDYLYIGDSAIDFEIPGTLSIIQNQKYYCKRDRHYPLYDFSEVDLIPDDIITFLIVSDVNRNIHNLAKLKNCILVIDGDIGMGFHMQRAEIISLTSNNLLNPVIIRKSYENLSREEFILYSAADIGGLQIDGFGDGIWLRSDNELNFINETAFGILQASRTRISKTEYISCPSCGRTLFDLQETTAMVRKKTDHLKGIKIGIMGCIVNGPGEMADAHYGYVGTGPGLISLYKGQEVVAKNIPSENAVDALIDLIRTNGDWVEPDNL